MNVRKNKSYLYNTETDVDMTKHPKFEDVVFGGYIAVACNSHDFKTAHDVHR